MFEYMLAVARVLICHSLMADCYSHHLSSLHLPYLVITHIDRQYQGSDNAAVSEKDGMFGYLQFCTVGELTVLPRFPSWWGEGRLIPFPTLTLDAAFPNIPSCYGPFRTRILGSRF